VTGAFAGGRGVTLRTARPCGCTQQPVMGAKRPKLCDHGNLFEKPASSSKPRRRSMQRKEPKRIWDDARAKVDLEARCRVCGWEPADTDELDAAHIMGRKYDQPAHTGTRTLYVNPLDIVPLCPVFAPEECHRRVDSHELDLLPFLAPEEQTRAVELAGGIEAARKRLAPSAYRLEVLA
jgi:hypothetical protein